MDTTNQIRALFDRNIALLDKTDRAVLYFREQNYRKALEYMPEISEAMRDIVGTILSHKAYFELEDEEFLMEMLEGILEAGKARDYVLLADLLELQLSTLLCNVQELIIKKEDFFAYSEEVYQEQCDRMTKVLLESTPEEDVAWLFAEPLSPEQLLADGYRVEFTSCGLMTAAVGTKLGSVYLHTNHKVSLEAFLLARSFLSPGVRTYLVRGFGMGYHVKELCALAGDAKVEVYESNGCILKLACAFAPLAEVLDCKNLTLCYDPDGSRFERRKANLLPEEKLCIHEPSMRAQG